MSPTDKVAMPQVTLGRTGITTSRLSVGAWGFGEASVPEAKAVGDQAIVDILRASFAAGVTYIDSAEAYDNEKRLGVWLDEAGRPDDLVISTKSGHGRGFTGDLFRASVERSLSDLRIEWIPLMMVHDPRNDDDMDIVLGKGGALEALRRCQDEGLVGYVGIATGTYGPLRRAVESDEFDAIQFPVSTRCSIRGRRRRGCSTTCGRRGSDVTRPPSAATSWRPGRSRVPCTSIDQHCPRSSRR